MEKINEKVEQRSYTPPNVKVWDVKPVVAVMSVIDFEDGEDDRN